MSQLAAIKRQSRAAAATKMGKMMDLQTQLERLSTADQIDEDALRRVFNELSTLRSDVAKEMFNEKIASMKVLTVAQRKQLRNVLDRRELGIPPLPRQMPPPGSRPSPPAP
jgi:Spy/CpxP family protein refolding chaperone